MKSLSGQKVLSTQRNIDRERNRNGKTEGLRKKKKKTRSTGDRMHSDIK